jgi:hypothetical protein
MLGIGLDEAMGVARGAGPEVLARIAEPGQAAAIWTRGRSPGFAAWIDAVPPGLLPSLRASCPVARAAELVDAACDVSGLPETSGREMLCADIAALAEVFGGVTGHDDLRLRLDVVQGDACRRFHVDNVPVRLLCTYRGRGTEYGLARAAGDPEPVLRMAAGDAGLFRGLAWPGAPRPNIVHRSPPIADSGEVRLLLVLDLPATR